LALSIPDSRSDIKLLFTDVVMPEVSGEILADEIVRHSSEFTTGRTQDAVGPLANRGEWLWSDSFPVHRKIFPAIRSKIPCSIE